jgi:hypothetical protein
MASWLLIVLTATLIVVHVALDWSHARRGPDPAQLDARAAAIDDARLRASITDGL